MADTLTHQAVSIEKLLALDALDQRYEVINGILMMMSPVGIEHSTIVFNIAKLLDAYVRHHRLGYVHPDNLMYVLQQDEAGNAIETRVPDVSFIRKGRLPQGFDRKRPFIGAPDLAVEVVSPSETAAILRAKITSYLQAGCTAVWVVYPSSKEVYVHTHSAPNAEQVQNYGVTVQFSAASLFPNLVIKVADFFAVDDFEND